MAAGAGTLTEEVVALCSAGQLEQAEEIILAALEKSPADRLLYELLGAVQLKRGAAVEAIGSIHEATLLGPPDARITNLQGLCHLFAGQPDRAIESFRKAIQIDPKFADGHLNLGWLSLTSGDIAEMNRCFRKWLSLRVPAAKEVSAPQPQDRLDLSRITLCCIDCAYQDLAIDALKSTLAKCSFAQTLFFTDKDFSLDDIRVVKIETISSAEAYSNFVIHELPRYVDTEFVLIVQYDGFVLHPEVWDDEFLKYDYIGAKVLLQTGYVVGNGGFSLRSKRLLSALQDEAISRYDARSDGWFEDMAICVKFRELLETRYGIRFAPGDVADKFAAESTVPTSANFGFHNLIHLVRMVENGFQDVDSPGSNRVTFSVKASSPIGEFTASNGVTIGGNPAFDREASRRA